MVKTLESRYRVAIILALSIFGGQVPLAFAKDDTGAATAWIKKATPVILKQQKQSNALPPNDPQKAVIQKDIQSKLDQTEAYVQSNPTNAPLLTAAADQSLQTGNIQQAQGRTAQALSNAKPDSAEWASAMNEHAKIAEQLGDYKTAAADSLQVLQKFPDDKDAMASYHINTERTAAAAPSAKAGGAAKKLAEAMAEPRLQPGGFRASSNSRQDPKFQATAQNIAALGHMKDAKRLLDMGDAEGALRAAAAAETASPDFKADADVMQAQAWSVLKDLSKALVQITEAIQLFTQQGRKADLAAALSQRAGFNNDLKNPADAAADATSALAANPKLASAYFERARADDALGKPEQALADIDQAALLDAGFMADRDDFHKRHRELASAGGAAAAPAPSWAAPLKSLGLFNVGVAVAGFLLLTLAGYIALISRKGSPVGRITWPRIARGAEDDTRDLNSQYRIVKKIGEGGMGTVYEGYDKNLKRPVAIKRLRPELQKNARERARFIKEAELVAALQHPHTVQIYTIIQNDEDTHIVFEYITGQTLHEVLNASSGRHLETRRALELLRQIAEAVDHAHERHVIHRDLKPANVMIDDRGWAKVMDFGIARQVADSLVITTTNTIVGTPTYMAPEQSMGEVKKESDVYALGITFYEMLTGGLPYKGADDLNAKISGHFLAPSLLLPGLPPAIDAVIAKAIAPRAEDRFHSCMELYRAAESALGQMTPT